MSNQPAYRNRNQAGPSGGWGILVPFFAAMILAIWPYAVWHGCRYGGGSGLSGCGAESEWVWNGQTWAACGIWWGTLGFIVALAVAGNRTPRVAGKRGPAPPKGRLRVEVLPDVPVRPICLHLGAVKVTDLYERVLHCWCPDCEAELPANFRRLCCATEPEASHMYNCPQGGPR